MNYYPNITTDYVGATGIHSINDYIDNTIDNDITTSNIFMNNGSVLNNSLYYLNNDLIIKNNYDLKEIKFFTYFNYTNFASKSGVKIDNIGKLQVYHLFNLLQPTFPEGYYDVEAEILQLKADGINTDLQLTLLEAGGALLQSEITSLKNAAINTNTAIDVIENSLYNNNTYQGFRNLITSEGNLTQYQDRAAQCLGELAQQALNKRIENLTNAAGFVLAVGVAGSALSYIGEYIQYTHARNAIFNSNNSNNNITYEQRRSTYNNISNYEVGAYSNFNLSMSNLNLINGFINCNITTPQNIPSINTNAITYQGVEISNTLNNYLLKQGGTMTGRINFNYGTNIFGNPVAGGGGSGERLNLNTNGITGADYPASLGVSSNSLWFSSPNNHRFQWFNNGIERMSLSSNGVLSVPSILENNLTLSNISQTTILNSTPNVQKRYLIEFTCSTPILMPNGQTLYKRDIDLRLYTSTKTIPNPSSPFRVFSFKAWIKSGYFEYAVNGNYNVLQYTIYQSLQSQNGSPFGSAGENLHAIGTPLSPTLNSITGGQICLVRTANFNYLSVLSIANGTVCQAIISDELF